MKKKRELNHVGKTKKQNPKKKRRRRKRKKTGKKLSDWHWICT